MHTTPLALLAAATLLLGACGSDANDPVSTTSAANATQTTALGSTTGGNSSSTTAVEAGEGAAAVEIMDFTFDPDPIRVGVGSTITWTNEDNFAHTVSSDEGDAITFDSGPIEAGKTFEMSFDETGEFPYFCMIHNQMRGSVVVS